MVPKYGQVWSKSSFYRSHDMVEFGEYRDSPVSVVSISAVPGLVLARQDP